MNVEAILLDIDGVLVDVRKSYLDSIRQTVNLYLEKILLVRSGSKLLLSRQDVNQFKLLGGFNNDWDTVYGLLLYLQSLLEKRNKTWEATSIDELRRLKNLGRLAKRVPYPCGVAEILTLVKDSGSIIYALAKDMFQEIYLGEKLFRKSYRRNPLFTKSKGLIHLEKLLIPHSLLAALKKKGVKLGIVTGRTRFEAEVVLKRFGLRKLFKALVSHDEVEREEKKRGVSLRKPHPFSLLLCAKKMGVRSFLYAGDLPDDIRAANEARKTLRVSSCGVLYGQDSVKIMERRLKEAGADSLIRRPASLLNLIDQKRSPTPFHPAKGEIKFRMRRYLL